MKKIWILHNKINAEQDDPETRSLCQAFTARDIEPMVLLPKYFDIITSRKSPKSIRYRGQSIDLPDTVLVRTGSGTTYFCLALLRQIENFDIPVINSSDSIFTSKDKMLSSQRLARAKLPTPRTMLVSHPINIDIVEQEIGFPCVVKLVTGSQGKGVYLCRDKDIFVNLMDLTENLKSKKTLLIQEFINPGETFDVRVWVIDHRARVAMKRIPPDGDFRANISRGGVGEPTAITDEMAVISQSCAKAFGLDITGIDLLYTGSRWVICEANSSPGFEGIDRFCGTDMASVIADTIRERL